MAAPSAKARPRGASTSSPVLYVSARKLDDVQFVGRLVPELSGFALDIPSISADEPESLTAEDVRRRLENASAVLFLASRRGPDAIQELELDVLGRMKGIRVLPVLLPGARVPPQLASWRALQADATDPSSAIKVALEARDLLMNRPAPPPSAPQRPRSPTLQRLERENPGEVSAYRAVEWILREHGEYGGVDDYDVDFVEPEDTRSMPVADWLAAVDELIEPGDDPLHGRLAVIGLALVEPELGRRLLESGLLPAVEAEVDPAPQTILTPDGRRVREALEAAPLPGYSADSVTAADMLGVERDVAALAAVLAARDNTPPLSVGLFGRWGTGKSFFMARLEERMKSLADDFPDTYCENVVHIRFNAWHYIDANLWASLVAHIFEELAAYGNEATRQEESWLERLETSREALDRAKRDRDEAKKRAGELRADLKGVESTIKGKSDELGRLRAGGSTVSLIESDEVRTEAARLAPALGISSAELDPADVNALVRQAGTLRGSARALWGRIRLGGLPLAAALVALLAVVGLGVALLLAGTGWLLAAGSAIVAALGVIGAVLGVAAPVAGLLEATKSARERRETELSAELDRLQAREEAERRAIAEAEADAARAQQELDELRSGRGLRRFIEERAASDHYKRHLGIIATIQRDFRELSTLLGPDAKDGREVPDIDRIVLYIDDLDRCPADRVVEVLQAVHLLLAFPLFVVVVGVDPRWLVSSLSSHHVAMLTSETRGVADPGEEGERASRPREYLEKIFQIPFSLAPMPHTGYARLVESLVSVRPSPAEVIEDELDRELAASGSDGSAADNGSAPEQQEPRPSPAEPAPGAAPRRIPPASLVLERHELELLSAAGTLISTPRAAKRLINLYRFVRASVPPNELREFIGHGTSPGEFRAVAVMLAVLVGQPDYMPRIFAEVRHRDQDQSWREALSELRGAYMNAPAEESDREWGDLLERLIALNKSHLPDSYPLSNFQRWRPRIERFSFEHT